MFSHAGMLGIVLEVVLETRRRIPIISTGNTKTVRTGAEAVAAVIGARAKADALFAILVPDKDYVYLEYRQKVAVECVGSVKCIRCLCLCLCVAAPCCSNSRVVGHLLHAC